MTLLVGLFVLFFALVALRVPVAVALAFSSLIGFLAAGLSPLNSVNQLFRGLDVFTILAVPFFLATGFLANATSVGQRLLDLAALMVGRITGAIGHVNVMVSMLFAGLSGSATADTAGVGSVLIPMMRERGYAAPYSAAITAVSSVIGSIIPPSIIMILYGAFATVSIGALFLGGVVPGIMIGVTFMGINYWYARRHRVDVGGRAVELLAELAEHEAGHAGAGVEPGGTGTSTRKVAGRRSVVLAGLRVIGRATLPLLVPVIIIAGIVGGVFTATEAGMVALVYLTVLGTIVYRELRLRQLVGVFRSAVLFYALPLLAAGTATVFGWLLARLGAGTMVRQVVAGLDVGPLLFLLVVIVIFLVVGTFLDAFPAIVLFAPIFLPGALAAGVHPVHLGVIVTMTLAVGLVTPPYGLCLLIAAKLARAPVAQVTRALLPFYVSSLVTILLIAAFPGLVMALPRLIMDGI